MTKLKSGSLILLALLLSSAVEAALHASLDRYRIAMGDTVRLTLSSDDDRDPGDADLSALEEHFEILQRSTSVNTQIINGQRSQENRLILELTPRRQGSFVIPPFEVRGVRSEALSVDVGPAPEAAGADEIVVFEADVDRTELYVQGQLLLTFRIQQAVNLDSRSITDLAVDGAYVESLGQNSFQRTINGRPWLVHEIRYAVFPESSGEIVIPSQTFSGRLGSGRRSLFDTRPAGRLVRRVTDELRINVLPRPAGFPDATWLPAAKLSLEESWSAPLTELEVGDTLTRSLTITADGLQGAQLPPIEIREQPGLRVYPDQPNIDNANGDGGITGIRRESIALVAVEPGDYHIPAVEVPWWNTNENRLEMARLPGQTIRVRAPAPTVEIAPVHTRQSPVIAGAPTPGRGPWPWIAAVCGIGWLITTVLWLRGRPRRTVAEAPVKLPRTPAEVLKACRANDAPGAERELRHWLAATGHSGTCESWAAQKNDPQLEQAVSDLLKARYGAGGSTWDGQALAKAIGNLKEPPAQTTRSALPALYPAR